MKNCFLIVLLFLAATACRDAKKEAVLGRWQCERNFATVTFRDDSVIVESSLPDNTRKSTFTVEKGKIIFETGERLTLLNDTTLKIELPLKKLKTKITCLCMKKK